MKVCPALKITLKIQQTEVNTIFNYFILLKPMQTISVTQDPILYVF